MSQPNNADLPGIICVHLRSDLRARYPDSSGIIRTHREKKWGYEPWATRGFATAPRRHRSPESVVFRNSDGL